MSKLCPRCSELLPDDAGFCPFDGAELQKSTDRFLGKTIAARYRLIKKLGAGGMSVVYLARHELISRLSALKILRPELSRIPEHRERFLREARAVNRINHENIVEITDVGESDGVAYLVMEYVEGESLLAQIQQGPLAWDRASRIALQVASALARTHQTGIIHRDLKPENILLVPRKALAIELAASPELVKLTDFGIAKMMGEPTLTLNEQLFGTPGYIAPEYVGGLPIDGRADIYSLAVVLYEMVTGQLPFEGRGQSDLLLKPLTSAPIPPSQRVSGLPPDLESLLLRCLARDPDERPHDAFALHDALVDILRRFAVGSVAPGADPATGSAPPGPSAAAAREPLETIIDRTSQPRLVVELATADVGRLVTSDMSARWATSLAELETHITRARRAGGESALVAGRAAELALVAGEMLPRVERATKMASELQARVDRLEAVGREFRGNLGHAIDVLVHDRSRERAHLDALRARREALQQALSESLPSSDRPLSASLAERPTVTDPRPWEIEALEAEERRAAGVVDDLAFQIETLQKQLDGRNEAHEQELVRATGALEGALSALRTLTHEVARSIADGIEMLQPTG
ncbi:MAG: protein kinase [Labilithrix sp.]|nr:protein kinase [Labilithrix sp.]MBX3218055.1 protein kinase [Labilithrix sp.]